MKILRYMILLSLGVALLAGCAGLPPVFPDAAGPTAVAPVEQAPTEPAVPPATEVPPAPAEPTATPEPAATAAPAATEAAPSEPQATPATVPTMADNALAGTVWEWAALIKTQPATQSVVPDPASYTLTFGADGQALLKADCNNANATYTLEGDTLTLQIGAVTRMACPPGSLSDEYLTDLSKVSSYLMDGGDLILRLGGTSDSMIFRNGGPAAEAAPPPAAATEAPAGAAADATTPQLIGPTWQWESFFDVATGKNSFDVKDPQNYTVTFNEDGTAAMKADCNQAVGTFTTEGASLTIEVGPVTLAACGPDSMGPQYLIYLTSAGTYMFVEGKLAIDLQADGGRMVFKAAQ